MRPQRQRLHCIETMDGKSIHHLSIDHNTDDPSSSSRPPSHDSGLLDMLLLDCGEKECIRQGTAMISEVYSKPRVVPIASKYGIGPGWSLDLGTEDSHGRQWDFEKAESRQRARELIAKTRPLLLILSPECRYFSALQNLSNGTKDWEAFAENRRRAVMHLEFCIELCRLQEAAGRYYLLEQPANATSWQEPSMVKFIGESQEVKLSTGHQC